jgi:hypothetical protein
MLVREYFPARLFNGNTVEILAERREPSGLPARHTAAKHRAARAAPQTRFDFRTRIFNGILFNG